MKYFFVLFLFIITETSFSQVADSIRQYPDDTETLTTEEGESVSFSLNSPYNTIFTHLKYLQPDSYYPEISARVFNLDNEELSTELAIQLRQVLDGKALYIDLDIIPREEDYMDSTTKRHRYILAQQVPEIYLEKVGEKWFYSRQTVQMIPELHHKIYPFGSDWLMNLMPTVGHKKFLMLELWQYLGILFFILVAFILHKILTIVIEFGINRLAKRIKLPNRDLSVKLFGGVSKGLSLLILSLFLVALVPILQLPIKWAKYVEIFFEVLTPFFGMLTAYRAVDILGWYLTKKAEETVSTMDDQIVPLVRKSLKIFVIVVGILFILSALDFNITALLAGVSIGGLAFALAAQDTIKNLFGSLMIFIDRPFQIGDLVSYSSVTGSIEDVGFRSTRIRTVENSLVYVPNGELANSMIDNKGLRIYRRYRTMVSLTYDTPPMLIEKFVEGLREIAENHPKVKKDEIEVHLNEMASASLNVIFNVFFQVQGWSGELKARHEIIMATLRLASELGIRFAFPTQTIMVEEFPEKKSTTPVYNADSENAKRKISEFMSNYKSGLEHYKEDQPGKN